MPAAALMVALTPHMNQLARAIEEHIEHNPSPDSARGGAGDERSPSRVTFSVERRPTGFAPGRHTSCTVVAEVVVRGVLPDGTGPFEQLMWSRRFKVGKATRDGETILEHRVFTVPVPEEIFRYAERENPDLTNPESRKNRKARRNFERAAMKVAPVPDGGGNGAANSSNVVHPKKSDLYAQEELEAQFAVVDELPDGCTFHLMCTLEIVKDGDAAASQGRSRSGDAPPLDATTHFEPYLLRRGVYETPIDPSTLLIADSTLLPVEMFAPFVEETTSSVDIVAFASVFAVVGDQLAAATHGDESNPSLVSSFLALAMSAQYDHLVFNVFRPELNVYRQGLQMALSRAGSGPRVNFAQPPVQVQQQARRSNQAPQQQQHQQGDDEDDDDEHDEYSYDDSTASGGAAHSPPPARPGQNQQARPQQPQSTVVPHFPPNKLQQQHQRQQEQRSRGYQRQAEPFQQPLHKPNVNIRRDDHHELSDNTDSDYDQHQQLQHPSRPSAAAATTTSTLSKRPPPPARDPQPQQQPQQQAQPAYAPSQIQQLSPPRQYQREQREQRELQQQQQQANPANNGSKSPSARGAALNTEQQQQQYDDPASQEPTRRLGGGGQKPQSKKAVLANILSSSSRSKPSAAASGGDGW